VPATIITMILTRRQDVVPVTARHIIHLLVYQPKCNRERRAITYISNCTGAHRGRYDCLLPRIKFDDATRCADAVTCVETVVVWQLVEYFVCCR